MDFDTLNKLISVVLFTTMVATLLGTIVLYGYYKAKEAKAKALRKQPVAVQNALMQMKTEVQPYFAEQTVEVKKKIRFG